jgi:predicted alpha/beta superfamily hydrolase
VSSSQLRKHERFRSRFLRNQRDLVVYVPAGYDEQPARRFPVLYMHDGQNLFDPATSFIPGMDWKVAQTADQLIAAGALQPLIVVGIYNAGKARIQEYTPSKAPRMGGGRADQYARFLLNELIPFIQREYRVDSAARSTGIGGSSLGGLLSLYLGLKFSDVFGRIAALSPSVWWDQRILLRIAAALKLASRPRIWLDVGTKEGAANEGPHIVGDVEQFRDLLLEKGWRLGHDLHYQCVQGAGHDEAAWAQRVGPFLQFLYPAAKSKV